MKRANRGKSLNTVASSMDTSSSLDIQSEGKLLREGNNPAEAQGVIEQTTEDDLVRAKIWREKLKGQQKKRKKAFR